MNARIDSPLLAALQQVHINWLLAHGVSPTAIIKPAPVMLCRGERARDGHFDENPDGNVFLAFEECDDFVFWRPSTGETVTAYGRAFALGEELIDNPATCALGQYLNIFADPLEWLKHERRGIAILNWRLAFERLRWVSRIAVAEALLPTYRRYMKPIRMPDLAVLPAAEMSAAA